MFNFLELMLNIFKINTQEFNINNMIKNIIYKFLLKNRIFLMD